ncbi:MAG: RNA 2',3'-cyclic phosphodiesterase [Tepidanaerobacteraceae bacterium]|nr:RNA 2',3'-cyclic phosphodiesterase [Tepidanaerobacteraceae bacterium]
MTNKNSHMHLFIAINFNEDIKNGLCHVIEKFKTYTSKGTFTYRENLHLTLVFLGEVNVSKIDRIKAAMDRIPSLPFTITMRGISHFSRFGGDIYWVGIDKNKDLIDIYKRLSDELTSMGFAIDKREFKPHLTLGRRIIAKDTFDENQFSDSITPLQMTVENIALMKSERMRGKLTYTKIYQKIL